MTSKVQRRLPAADVFFDGVDEETGRRLSFFHSDRVACSQGGSADPGGIIIVDTIKAELIVADLQTLEKALLKLEVEFHFNA